MQPIFTKVKNYFLESLVVFTDCLHELMNSVRLSLTHIPESISSDPYAELYHRRHNEKKLLVILNNTMHTKSVILYDLVYAFVEAFMIEEDGNTMRPMSLKRQPTISQNTFDRISLGGFHSASMASLTRSPPISMAQIISDRTDTFLEDPEFVTVWNLYNDIIGQTIDCFVRSRTLTALQCIRGGMILSGYDWQKSPAVTSVRSFVLELLLESSLVHSWLKSMEDSDQARNVVSHTIFCKLSDRIAELFYHYASEHLHRPISKNGALQLHTELEFIREVLGAYETNKAKELHSRIKEHLMFISSYDPNDATSRTQRSRIIEQMLEKTKVQLHCFLNEDAMRHREAVSRSGNKKPGGRRGKHAAVLALRGLSDRPTMSGQMKRTASFRIFALG